MTLPFSKYLLRANVQDHTVCYNWDDWDDLPALDMVDEQLMQRLGRVSQRAILAIACGSAEWLLYRFARLLDESEPRDYIEAAWAMIVSIRYCGYQSTNWQYFSQEHWAGGPIKGPIKDALIDLEIANQQLVSEYRTDPARLVATLSTLTCYVMTDAAPYKEWQSQVLDRLETLYPRHPDDLLGDVVPHEAVDPDFNFKIEDSETLINAFLASLDFRSNIFLSTPEGMLEHVDGEEDFKGVPYRFDLTQDRASRRRSTNHDGHRHNT